VVEKYEAAQDTSGRWRVTRALPDDADASVEILATCNTRDVALLLVDALNKAGFYSHTVLFMHEYQAFDPKFRDRVSTRTFDVENPDGEE
jgi:hypothetical protein